MTCESDLSHATWPSLSPNRLHPSPIEVRDLYPFVVFVSFLHHAKNVLTSLSSNSVTNYFHLKPLCRISPVGTSHLHIQINIDNMSSVLHVVDSVSPQSFDHVYTI